jgi:hypothetical protein
MPSQLNISIPREGNPTTAEERNNWSIASSEITACQNALATLESTGGAGNAVSIQGIVVSATPPVQAGQVLTYNGTNLDWAVPNTTVTMGGDVVGLSNATTVSKINGIPVQGSPASGQVLTYNGVNLGYQAVTAPSVTAVTMGGDIQGQSNASQVTALYGRAIANVAPTTGQSLAWNGAAYAPTSISGIAPNLSIGTVTNVSTGQSATATITGTNPNYQLNLGLPVGATGAAGVGTPGATGQTGATGPAPTLNIGTVSTLAAGAQATATFTGTNPYSLNLGIPQGSPGSASPPGSITLTGDVNGADNATVVQAIHGIPVASGTPTLNYVLTYNGSAWAAAAPTGGTPGGVSFPIAGTNASAQPPASGSLVHIANNDAINTSMQVDSSGSGVSAIEMRKMGGTMASPAMPGANSQLGFLRFQGYVGAGAGDGSTNFGAGAEIQVLTGPTAWSGSAMATIVQFLTTAASESASSGKTIKMFIGPNGGLVIGNAAGGDMGPGTINVGTGLYVNGIQLTVP